MYSMSNPEDKLTILASSHPSMSPKLLDIFTEINKATLQAIKSEVQTWLGNMIVRMNCLPYMKVAWQRWRSVCKRGDMCCDIKFGSESRIVNGFIEKSERSILIRHRNRSYVEANNNAEDAANYLDTIQGSAFARRGARSLARPGPWGEALERSASQHSRG
jgi:hypothetical protein